MLSVIIVSYNTENILRKALTHVYKQKFFTLFEVIVVDNASRDNSCEMVRNEFPQVKLIRNPQNTGFAGGNNLGIKEAKGDYILLLNSDAYVFDDTFQQSINHMTQHPKTGIMGVQLICENGSPQPSAREFPTPWKKLKVMTGYDDVHPSFESYYDYYDDSTQLSPEPRKVDWVPGTYFLIRREVVDEIGLLDENFFLYFEEVDYCFRAKKAGWNVVFNPKLSVIHLGGQSSLTTKKEISRDGKQLVDIRVNSEYYYYRKNSGLITMLMAAVVEIGWKSLVYVKNYFISDKFSPLKIDEAKLAINLVLLKMKKELVYN